MLPMEIPTKRLPVEAYAKVSLTVEPETLGSDICVVTVCPSKLTVSEYKRPPDKSYFTPEETEPSKYAETKSQPPSYVAELQPANTPVCNGHEELGT